MTEQDTCRHCDQPITLTGSIWAHVVGPGSVLIRCNPINSGQPYGLDATPANQKAARP